jgi:transmembrane sensor
MKDKTDQEKAEYLAHKWSRKTLSTEEMHFLEQWYNSHDDEIFSHSQMEGVVKKQMWKAISSKIGSAKTIPFWIKTVSAACLTLTLGSLFYLALQKPLVPEPVFIGKLKEIGPGGNAATLTLSNGKKVELKQVPTIGLSEEGVQITKEEEGKLSYQTIANKLASVIQQNTLETPAGGQYQVVLSDGSKIWLNSNSSLRYPANFRAAKERIVELEGEGYFEIQKDSSRPFIVRSRNQRIQVKGTKFNVNTYSDEPNIATTLVEGSVAIENQYASLSLSPDEQALNDGKSISKERIDARAFVSWKDGYFEFNNTDLNTAMRQISRWYGLKVVYADKLPSKHFTGKIYRDLKLSNALKILSYFEVRFTVDDHTIYISN